ncbi:hypothetical protein [Streptomyces sp. NPDC058632]|uniref:hypothetical protein n=1 Tax=unclassified Streptomyces TaxID=2593676 RepID=UPI00365D8272
MVFSTNPLSVAYGACSPALFLRTATTAGAPPPEAAFWMRRQPAGNDTYPPGLYVGLGATSTRPCARASIS